jgi:4-amino-4-deoxy-L-arabinose transferase-like glycosyltransferase
MTLLNRVMGGDSPTDRWWGLGLLFAAIVLYTTNLGTLPLRDWDEGTVAGVAREIWRAAPNSSTWLYPTLDGTPYLNKPPLVHWCIALFYHLGGVNEWTTRLPCALFAAASVPMLYALARELFPQRQPALFAALIYLTLLPVVRHGRLAMLDGAVLCFFLIFIWCVLRSRRDLRYALGIGLSLGCLLLTKGTLGLLLGAIAVAFLAWDTPRLLTNLWVWLGVGLGSLPATLWYGAQWHHYGLLFAKTHLLNQSFDRLWTAVEANTGEPWYYAIELLKYPWPWFLFWLPGLKLIWTHRNLSASKLVLVWTVGYLSIISLMGTKLPWYILPVYPAFALVCGVKLAEVWQPSAVTGMPEEVPRSFSRLWMGGVALLAVGAWGATLYFGFSPQASESPPDIHLCFALLTMAVTMTLTFGLMVYRDAQFAIVLIWGMYLSLLLFVSSTVWIWELNEDYPVKPVAAAIRQVTPPNATIYTDSPHNRPSLNFYSDRAVMLADEAALRRYWQQHPQPYFLVRPETIQRLALDRVQVLGEAEGWQAIGKQPPPIVRKSKAQTKPGKPQKK